MLREQQKVRQPARLPGGDRIPGQHRRRQQEAQQHGKRAGEEGGGSRPAGEPPRVELPVAPAGVVEPPAPAGRAFRPDQPGYDDQQHEGEL